MICSTDAITLRSRKFGDSSKIIVSYTKDYGICSLLAKGARKSRSKFGSSLEPLSYARLNFYKRPNRDLHLLSGSELIVPFHKLQDSYEHLFAGLMILESVYLTQRDYSENVELFEFLKDSVILLNETPKNPFSVFIAFQLFLTEQLGFGLDLKGGHHENGHGRLHFSLQDGGIYNSNGHNTGSIYRFNNTTFEKLMEIQSGDMNSACGIELDKTEQKELHDFFVRYYSFHLEKNFSFKTFKLFGLY